MVDLKQANIDTIRLPLGSDYGVDIDVLRLDNIHPVVSGNKWFKLKNYLEDAVSNHFDTILTFGGAYSNHIVATAFAASQSAIPSIGVIRGEKNDHLNETLKQAESFGMTLHFIGRQAYKNKSTDATVQQIVEHAGKCYLIPEGGAGAAGIAGCEEILSLTNQASYSHIVSAIGTGTMFLGLAKASFSQELIGIPVLKGVEKEMERLLQTVNLYSTKARCRFFHEYHFGGYAKENGQLIDFMNNLYAHHRIPSDFVYTGKLFYALNDLAEKNYFPEETKVLAIHSGGLQGNHSLTAGMLVF